MKPPFDIAADLDTPVSAFLKLKPLRPRFLLESVEGGERLGRYSILGFGEAVEVRLDADSLRVDGQVFRHVTDAASRLDAIRAVLPTLPEPGPLIDGVKFGAGLFGAVTWEFVRRLEHLPTRSATGPEMSLLAPKSLLVFDHVSRRIALLHAGPDDERAALRKQVDALLRGPIPEITPGTHEIATPSFSEAEFCTAVSEVREHIAAGDIFQLVLSVRFEGATTLDPFQVYRALRLLNPSPYLFYFDLGDQQIVGSSPEALVKLEGRVATLRPIAGTRPRGASEPEDAAQERDLRADAKEAAEHVMLVDLARNDLGRVAATGSIVVEPYRSIERYSHVMHLVSGVRGRIADDKDALDLFAAAFPAGTVSGAPKVRAMELIDALEPVPRGLYAGTVGYFGANGDMDQAIAIRTLSFANGRYCLQAGAGIVADSVAELEYAEVLAKSGALRAALRLAEDGL